MGYNHMSTFHFFVKLYMIVDLITANKSVSLNSLRDSDWPQSAFYKIGIFR
jgi:hypothetical protein